MPADAPPQPETGQGGTALSRPFLTYVVLILFLTHVLSYIDRMALAVLLPAIKADYHLSDVQLGLLTGIAFTVSYAIIGIPIARLADRSNRRNVIGIAVLVWSGMTALTGVAQHFWHLMAARLGVGAGEAGCIPPAHSLMGDIVPDRIRVGVLSFYTAGMPVGSLLGFALGGWLSDLVGWRHTFFIFGAAGGVLGLLLFLTVPEPLRRTHRDHPATSGRPFSQEVRLIARNPAFLCLLAGLGFAGFAITGLVQWLPSYFARTFNLSMREIGPSFGVVYGLGSMCGIFFGGMIASPFFARDQRWALWIPVGAYVCAFPLILAAIFTGSFPIAMACLFFGFAILTCGFGPVYALVQNIVPRDMRALAISLTLFASNLIGAGLGPLLIGFASDQALAHGASHPLQVGVLVGMGFFPFPAIFYLIGSRFLTPKAEPHLPIASGATK
ncbi:MULTISPECIES: spinster family MFS transporter [unclassified Sphingomonas]|uniref:spinster family MFS transporter n=1 Tax=unclassified Sphingomonas TaxID=196159 RepID=UPI0006F6497D|nr:MULTISPECIES: MFS transporter [unclassified Sphingomonas]KQX19445.1 hypothetical protein ASD17_13000 [Sphingomonas sp. Root1294]KQY65646.1 hypothetical protein ASD39_16200 [Sphingomonas sp. Root50]KRB95050.1 hypothetical protein ASE22_03855 [Sphingomonas sp. Root720]